MNDRLAVLRGNLKKSEEALNKNQTRLEEEQALQKRYIEERYKLLIGSPEDPRITAYEKIIDEERKEIDSILQQIKFYEVKIELYQEKISNTIMVDYSYYISSTYSFLLFLSATDWISQKGDC